ncbi:hypothetical protein ACRE1W_09785, partial [Streptococcus pneumoniae]
IGLTTTLKNAWTTSRQVNFFWVANFNLKFGKNIKFKLKISDWSKKCIYISNIIFGSISIKYSTNYRIFQK